MEQKVASPGRFHISGEGAVAFDGYDFGESWNGWAVPYFTKQQAERVRRENEKLIAAGINVEHVTYDASTDSFILSDSEPQADQTPVKVKGERILTRDGPKKVYSIGGYSWVWEKARARTPRQPRGQNLQELRRE